MIGIRIVCHYCSALNDCPMPLDDFRKPKNYACVKCEGHLFEIRDDVVGKNQELQTK